MRHTTRRFWTMAGVVALTLAALVPVVAQRGGGPGGGGGGPKPSVDHKARQLRPIALGVSGGNATDTANGFCCSGTLGALVQNAQGQFILSNSHVFAQDIEGDDVAAESAIPSTSRGSSTLPARTGPTTTSPRSRRCRRSTLDSFPPWRRRAWRRRAQCGPD